MPKTPALTKLCFVRAGVISIYCEFTSADVRQSAAFAAASFSCDSAYISSVANESFVIASRFER